VLARDTTDRFLQAGFATCLTKPIKPVQLFESLIRVLSGTRTMQKTKPANTKLDPHLAQARVNLGNVEAANGRWRSAEACYRRALSDSAADWDAMNNLAIALLRQGRKLEEARALAERAVASGGARDSIYRATLAEVKSGTR